MKFPIVATSALILLSVSACSSESKNADSEKTNTDPSEISENTADESSENTVDESLENTVDGPPVQENNLARISSLSESIDSFEGVHNIGWFEINESEDFQYVDSRAVFFEIDSENPQSNRATIFLDRSGDTCAVEYRVSRLETIFNDMTENANTVSVGEVITMFEEGAPYKYSELAHVGLATEGSYINYLDLPYPSPEALNISAVGEVFNGFSFTVDKPAPIEKLSIEDGLSISSGSSITWTASEYADTMVQLKLEERTDDLASYVVDCMLIDDGQFTLPSYTDLGLDSDAKTILQEANRIRVGTTRTGNDQVVMLRGTFTNRQ